jgi:hypothetical protein
MVKRRKSHTPRVEISTDNFYGVLAETFNAFDAAGMEYLKKHAIAFTGVESDFGNTELLRREVRAPRKYTGVYQLGRAHSQYLTQTPEAQQLRDLGVLHGHPRPDPRNPYKNQGVLGAVSLMHYATIAKSAVGKEENDLTARDLWTLHLFGQNGGKALLEAVHKNPDILLKDVSFNFEGETVRAVNSSAYNGNIGPNNAEINPQRIPYNKVTVGQAFDMIQNHFERRATALPEHLDANHRDAFKTAIRSDKGNKDIKTQPVQEVASNNVNERHVASAYAFLGIDPNTFRARNGIAPEDKAKEAASLRDMVKAVQTDLQQHGVKLARHGADGIVGKETRKAAEIYRADNGKDLPILLALRDTHRNNETLYRRSSPLADRIIQAQADAVNIKAEASPLEVAEADTSALSSPPKDTPGRGKSSEVTRQA